MPLQDQLQQPQAPAPPPVQAPRRSNTLALVSIGLAAVAWITQAHILTSIPAIIIGIIAIVQIRREPEKYDVSSGMVLAILGIVMGALNALIIVGAVAIAVVMIALDVAL